MTEEELNDYITYADQLRGVIISHTVLLERNMDLFICKYFCSTTDKAFELMELLVSERVDFSKKAETFAQILIKECTKDNKDFTKEYPRLKTDFQEIYETRNVFAHKLLKIPQTKESIGNHVIILRELKNKSDDIPYTQEQINGFVDKIEKYSKMIKAKNNPTV